MRRHGLKGAKWLCGLALLWPAAAGAQVLTADGAVHLALLHNTQAIGAEAGIIEAKGGVYSAYSGILPSVSASLIHTQSRTDNSEQVFPGLDNNGNPVINTVKFAKDATKSTTPGIAGSLPILNLSNWSNLSSAKNSLRAAKETRGATRNDVALATRRQFYEVVRAIRLSTVQTQAFQLASDNERRVRALFEVGSVSKSDLLTAQTATSQAELDMLIARNAVVTQRITLADLIGVTEDHLGQVDTVMTVVPHDYDESSLIAEAAQNRPDMKAANLEVKAAHSAHISARLTRLPYVTMSGTMSFNPSNERTTTTDFGTSKSTGSADRDVFGQVALRWDIFSGGLQDARIAVAQGRVIRAEEARDATTRAVTDDVRRALNIYREALEGEVVARRATDSANESLKLVQEKYNVGSATILDLVNAQVQLARTQSDGVSALAAIRVAEAQIDRARGRAE